MRLSFYAVAAVMISILISACSQPAPITPMPTDQPTEDSASTTAPSRTPAPTRTPTETPIPTDTPRPTPGPSLDELLGTPNAFAASADLTSAQAEFEALTNL